MRVDLDINNKQWIGFFEDVEKITIERTIGTDRKVRVIETFTDEK